MMVSEIKLYEILRVRLGDKEAEALVEFVDTKLKERDEENSKVLATKQDVSDLLKWMIVMWITQLGAMAAMLKLFH